MRLISNFFTLLSPFVSSTINTPSIHGMVFDLRILGDYGVGFPVRGLHDATEDTRYVQVDMWGRESTYHGIDLPDTFNIVNITGGLIPVNFSRSLHHSNEPEIIRLLGGDNYGSISVLNTIVGSSVRYSSLFISWSPRSTPDSMMLQMLVNPGENVVDQYCREGPILYAPLSLNNHSLRFMAQASLVDPGSCLDDESNIIPGSVSEPHHYTVSFGSDIGVPESVLDVFEREIEASINMTWSAFERHPECGTMIDRLPTIRLTILDELGYTALVNVHIEPSEYVVVYPSNPVQCRIKVSSLPGAQLLGRPIFKNVGVVIDYAQQRIGFCDTI